MGSPDGSKPLDVGTGVVCASFAAATAGWLAIGATHDRHGFVEASAVPPFDERERGDPAATRAHRARLADPAFALVDITSPAGPPSLVADPSDPRRPRWRGAGISVEAWGDEDATGIVQRWTSDRPLRVSVGGTVDRPALAEITELDPPQPTGAVTELAIDGDLVTLYAPVLPATVTARIAGARWRLGRGRAGAELSAGTWEIQVAVGQTRPGRPPRAAAAERDPLVARALAYVRGCTALRVAPGERTILTDHRLLPLSWTRDAYYQALLLLVADAPGDRERVADHLRWLWRRCERPDGRWVRSHHANGRRKDLAFQADQQLYPIVELADYWRLAGSLPHGVDWTDAIRRAWAAATEEVDAVSGLIASSETAADDPAEAPFIGASQILLWYAARRLVELDAAGVVTVREAAAVADRVRASFDRHLLHEGRWAYAADGIGGHVAYHDANDLPIALAPWWGFCDADDPAWRATIGFAFSDANPGHAGGTRGGLGSVHTPGAWTLGDVQRWIVARTTGDPAAADTALARLREVALPDGMLPEAYSTAPDPDRRIRLWFAWPGAALAALLLIDRDGDVARRLGSGSSH